MPFSENAPPVNLCCLWANIFSTAKTIGTPQPLSTPQPYQQGQCFQSQTSTNLV